MRAWRPENLAAFAKICSFSTFLPSISASRCPASIFGELTMLLSPKSQVLNSTASIPRWSIYSAPKPHVVVNVSTEHDVAKTVQYCNQHNLTFVAQNGGNGWADTFDLGQCGVIINIGKLRKITFNADKTQVAIQGGVRVDELISNAYDNGARINNPTCTCLGFLGVLLGGGLSRSMGLYGTNSDQLLSADLVLASSEVVRVTANDTDLWWALRGAGANFGIVTSAVIKSYPVSQSQNVAWQGTLTIPDDKVEDLVAAISDLDLKPHMQIDFLFSTSGFPDYIPGVSAVPIFIGNDSTEAEKAFAPILRLSTNNTVTEIPYNAWGTWGNPFYEKGGYKPAYGASLGQLDPKTWVNVYNEFKAFVASNPTAYGRTSILAENYPLQKSVSLGNATSSYPWRAVPHHVVAIPWYTNSSLNELANQWGEKIRNLWWSTSGLSQNACYINFAHGDEPLESIYGDSLPRLKSLKMKYDPQNRFNQWFPLA